MTVLNISIPEKCEQESRYIVEVMLSEFLGLDYELKIHDTDTFLIEFADRQLEISAAFFVNASDNWLQPGSLPAQPLAILDLSDRELGAKLTDSSIPVISGDTNIEIANERIYLGLDVFGSAFFMLSRYEEAVVADRDQHGRFPSSASLARQENFLLRPIINEYLEILWACMARLWPNLKRRGRTFRILVSADLDQPYNCSIKSVKALIRRIGGDLLRRRSFVMAVLTFLSYFRAKSGDYSLDSLFSNIFWIMDKNERAGNRVAFYFITDNSRSAWDGCYSMDEPVIRDLARKIHERGHEIGLHPGYTTFQNSAQTSHEAQILRQVLKEEGIEQETVGGRQHYLRWETPVTARNWEMAGLNYDTTLAYADHAGFRCGICYEYPFYDVEARQPLKLRERPLVVMDCSVIAAGYMNMGSSNEALEFMQGLKEVCRRFDGDFTLLWHNSYFSEPMNKTIYEQLIQ